MNNARYDPARKKIGFEIVCLMETAGHIYTFLQADRKWNRRYRKRFVCLPLAIYFFLSGKMWYFFWIKQNFR